MKIYVYKKDSYENFHSSYIYHNQKLETTQVSIDRRMDKQTVIQSYNEMLLRNKKERSTQKTWMSLKNSMLSERSLRRKGIKY